MTVINPDRVFSITTTSDLLDEFEDETLESVSDDALPDPGGLLVEAQIQPFLDALPGDYWWSYTHDEYQDAEIVVVELAEEDGNTWEAVAGIRTSDLPDGCPSCGSDHLKGVQNEKAEVDISTSGSTTFDMDHLLETRFSSLDCFDCGLTIIEDAEFTEKAQSLME